MSRTDWNSKQTKKPLLKKPNLEVIQKLHRVPVVISDAILDKIRYLCSEIAKVEWSGVLIYAIEGSIKDVENFKCIIKEIIPMDKGSKTLTEYSMDGRVTDYFEEEVEEDRFEYRIGHIHSHNTMETYFSGTDMSELNDNSEHHNYYLSLIVNNFMEMTAKIAYRAEIAGFSYVAEDENGDTYSEDICLEKTVMMTYNCNISIPQRELNVSDDFMTKVKVIKTKKKPSVKSPMKSSFNNYGLGYKSHPNKGSSSFGFDGHEDLDFEDDLDDDTDELFDLEYFEDTTDEFTCTMLRLSRTVMGDSVDTAMEDVITGGDWEGVFARINSHYEAIFYEYYKDFPECTSEVGIEILGVVINNLETYEKQYPEFKILINQLKDKFDEYGKQ